MMAEVRRYLASFTKLGYNKVVFVKYNLQIRQYERLASWDARWNVAEKKVVVIISDSCLARMNLTASAVASVIFHSIQQSSDPRIKKFRRECADSFDVVIEPP